MKFKLQLSFDIYATHPYLDISLPEGGLAVLSIPEVVEDSMGTALGVISLHGVPVMEAPVEGAACQGGDAEHRGDDGKRGDDLPPHFICKQD